MDRASIGERGMVSTLLVVVDGLRATDVRKMPFLTQLAHRGVSYRQARSVAPSLTRPAAASLASGAPPGVTGIPGNRLWADGHLIDTGRPDHLVELLRSLRGDRLLPVPALGEHLADHGHKLVAVGTGSNGCTLLLNPGAVDGHGAAIGARPFGHDAFYARPESVRRRLAGSLPQAADGPFPELDWATDLIVDYVIPELAPDVLVLWSGELDDVQHANGVDGPAGDDALSEIDRRLRRLIDRVREQTPHTDVIVTADHGFSNATHTVDVADIESLIPPSLTDAVQLVDNAPGTDTHSVGALVRLMLGATPAQVAPALAPPAERAASTGSWSTDGTSSDAPHRHRRPVTIRPSSRHWAPPLARRTCTSTASV
ncbi:hypothetical protein CGL27_00410 [Streptomyces sp. 11-1-2]|nr:hypothetical protein CGL27_00410 [Streptomyces sp. 11-1-2]